MIYELDADDEKALDLEEEVPTLYIKCVLSMEFINIEEHGVVGKGKTSIDALVYIDVKRLQAGPPLQEYIMRINKGVADGVQEGIPTEYFEKYVRPFIPAPSRM